MNRALAVVGGVVTAAYAFVIAWVLWGRLEQLGQLKPNEMGDFLAGVFGPIAVLWLILGFFQQGIELRDSRKALQLQTDELKNSTEQQRELVKVSREQLQAERALAEQAADARFVFRFQGSTTTGGKTVFNLHIANVGAAVTSVRIVAVPPLDHQTQCQIPVFRPGDEFPLDVRFADGHPQAGDTLTVSYRNAIARERSTVFGYVIDASNSLHIEAHEG